MSVSLYPSGNYQTFNWSTEKYTIGIAFQYSGPGTVFGIELYSTPYYGNTYNSHATYIDRGTYYVIEVIGCEPSAYIDARIFEYGDEVTTPDTRIFVNDHPSYPSTYYPTYTPRILHQLVYNRSTHNWDGEASTCVPCAIVTMKDIQEYREGRGSANNYSICWVYGNREVSDFQGEGMVTSEALTNLMTWGTPQAALLSNYLLYPDNYYYTSSAGTGKTAEQEVIDNWTTPVLTNAGYQRIQNFSKVSRNISMIKSWILATGCALIAFNTWSHSPPDMNTGYWPEYGLGSQAPQYHLMCIVGWKKYNGICYWIGANSWGDWVGDHGLFYIPFFTDFGEDWYLVSDGRFTPTGPSVPAYAPVFDTSIGVGGRLEGGIALKWGVSTNAVGYRVKLRNSVTTQETTHYFSGTSGQITGLTPGVTYYASVCGYNNEGYSAYTSENAATVAPITPGVNLFSTTANTITVQLSPTTISGYCDLVAVYLRFPSGSFSICNLLAQSDNHPDYTQTKATFYGLSPGVTYTVNARSMRMIDSNAIYSVNYSNTLTITTGPSRPSNYGWATAKVQGQPVVMTATEWNNFTSSINAFRTYCGLTTTTFTPATGGGTLSAAMFNEANVAINACLSAKGLAGTGIATQGAKGVIYASYLNTLVSKLNSL